jgi:hypothetical protein
MTDDSDLLGLESLPRHRDTARYADYVELLCLANADLTISRADFIDRWQERRDLGETAAVAEDEVDDTNEDGEPSAGVGQGERSDWRVRMTDDVFRQLAYRLDAFAECYPFEMPSRTNLLRKSDLTDDHRLYVFLLLAASQSHVRDAECRQLRRAFERLTADVLRALLPAGAEVHVFGTSASLGERFHGAIYPKLSLLASDMAEYLHATKDEFDERDVGDAGLDVVGWIPLGDTVPNPIAFFAQSATGTDWIDKQHQSGADAWRSILMLHATPANLICIPHCWRTANGGWPKPHEIHNSVVLDRVRVMNTLCGKGRLDSVPYDLVDRAIAYTEQVV